MQNSHSHHEERWDIYDRNKQRTGRTMRRNDFTLADDEYHLSVLGVVRTPDGRFLITRRKMDKRWAPGWWEVPGGGVMAGEVSLPSTKTSLLILGVGALLTLPLVPLRSMMTAAFIHGMKE